MSSSEPQVGAVHFGVLAGAGTDAERQAAQQQGYAAGYAQGIRAGQQAARAAREQQAHRLRQAEAERAREQAGALDALHRAAAGLAARNAPVLDEALDTVREAALELAEAILGRALADHELAARAALERATAQLDVHTARRVRLHPRDLELLARHGTEAGIELAADPGLERGDALVDFEDGFLDARIATALERVTRALREETP